MSGENLEKKRELPLDRELPPKRMEQPLLDGFLQAEAEAREASIDRETMIRYRQSLAARWFNYYKRTQNQKRKQEILRQYNRIANINQRS